MGLKKREFLGENERFRDEVELLRLEDPAFFQQLPLVFADVLNQKVFSRQLVMVAKVIHFLRTRKVSIVHLLMNPFFICPYYVPIIHTSALPALEFHCLFDGVDEGGFELYGTPG